MKKFFLRLVLRDKFIGQLASAGASAAAAYLVSLIPQAPELVLTIVKTLMEIPPDTEITSAGVTVILTPVIYSVLSAVVQELVAKDNNRALAQLKDAGVYDGPMDGWVGPIAAAGIDELANKTTPMFKDQ